MKVFHTESSLGWGGQENRTLNECLGLRSRGIEVAVVAPPSARLLDRAAQSGIATYAVVMRRSLDPFAILALARLLRKERPDIVSTHSGRDTIIAGLAAQLVPRRPRIVRTRHLILPITSKFTYAVLPDHVVGVSRAVREYLVGTGLHADAVTAVPTGIDFTRFDRTATAAPLRAELGLAPDTLIVGTMAILRKKKGHHHLLEAAAQVVRQVPRVHFVFSGNGPQEENLRRQAGELGLEGRVSFLGLRRDVPEVLAAFDLFVLPTRQEALGTAFIEAQAMGVPVIGSRVGGVPETLQEGESGLLVPPEDPRALAAAIVELAQDADRRERMGACGSAFVRKHFSVDAMVEGMLDVYRKVLAAQ